MVTVGGVGETRGIESKGVITDRCVVLTRSIREEGFETVGGVVVA